MPEWLITTLITLVANIVVWLVATGKFIERMKNVEKRVDAMEKKFDNRTMLPECLKVVNANLLSNACIAADIKEALARLETKVEFIIDSKDNSWNGKDRRLK
jgi:predicted RND superfamily exporter protein